jgi:hypothetical protein
MRLITLLFVFITSFYFYPQQFDWAKVEGRWAYDYGYGVVNDVNGNIYMAGKYEQQAIFGGLQISNRGNHDIFLSKYDAAGNLLWIRTGGGVNGDYATTLATDGGNNLFIAGEIEGYGVPVYFDGSTDSLVLIGDNDVFLACYDLNGNFKWATSAGGFQSDKALGVTTDAFGNCYICGYFTDTIHFGNSNFLYGQGQRDLFIAKYDSSGNFIWARGAGSIGRDEAKSIACDASGNIYLTGLFSNQVDFGGLTVNSPNGYYDMFLAKYDLNGNLLWLRTGSSAFDEVGWSLAVDGNNRVYVGGEFNAYAVFDSQALVTNGMSDCFIACYDSSGAIQWARSAGGSLIDRARGICCDGQSIFFTGQFGGQAQFGNSTLTASDSSDIFVSSFDLSGNFLWSMRVEGEADSLESLGYESGNSICSDISSGSVYTCGALLNGGIFGSDSLEGYTRTDVFLCKIIQPTLSFLSPNRENNLFLFPNPVSTRMSLKLPQHTTGWHSIYIYDFMGLLVFESEVTEATKQVEIDISNLMQGTYSISLVNKENRISSVFQILN